MAAGVERTGVHKKPGLLELLAFVKNARLPMAVATSSEAEYASFTLSRAGVGDWFDAIVSGDQVAHGKPAPDIYLEAARRLAVSAADCVAFEDSEAGIQAVSRAGMTGILVPHWPVSADAARCRLSGRRHASRRQGSARVVDRGPPLLDRDRDLLGQQWLVVRDVHEVSEDELQRVGAGR